MRISFFLTKSQPSDSIGISDKGLFWGRRPLTALNGHLMNLVGPFLALKKKKCWFSKLKSILKIKKYILDYYSERNFF